MTTETKISEAFEAWAENNSAYKFSSFTENAFYAGYLAAMASLEQVAWQRKWSADGEVPKKEKRENGRMAWPFKFKLMPVTEIPCLPDDVPLYRIKERP